MERGHIKERAECVLQVPSVPEDNKTKGEVIALSMIAFLLVDLMKASRARKKAAPG